MTTNAELAKALVKARRACDATVFKAGKNSAQGYSFTGHLHVLTGGARRALLDHGLSLVQVGVSFAGVETYKTRSGEQVCWRWRGDFVLVHDSGETMALSYEATTGANDKAAFVASTALDRTAHMRVLELAGSDEENPEHDTHSEPQSMQVSGDMFADMAADLGQRAEPDSLTQWARDLALLKARADQKKPLWDAFKARCESLGLNPATLAANARKAA